MAAGVPPEDSASFVTGFSVYQPAIGDPVQFFPLLGTQELNDLLAVYVPGPVSVQDRITAVTLDFFDHASHTGESFKFYPVISGPCGNAVEIESPASSTAMPDSGYGSSFNASPVAASMSPWTPSVPDFTAPSSLCAPAARRVSYSTQSLASSSSASMARSYRPAAAPAAVPSARTRTSDFSNLPGMRILTKDGHDVTNSASRGCKTKEQRDHAHLMRIIKACDSCRQKKVRCDPSHKKRTSNGHNDKPRKTKNLDTRRPAQDLSDWLAGTAALAAYTTPSPIQPDATSSPSAYGDFTDDFLDLSGAQLLPVSLDDAFFFGADACASSGDVFDQVSAPDMSSQNSVPTSRTALRLPDDQAPSRRSPRLPYLQDGDLGTNYVDFSLYSPTSSALGEELPDTRTWLRSHATTQQPTPLQSPQAATIQSSATSIPQSSAATPSVPAVSHQPASHPLDGHGHTSNALATPSPFSSPSYQDQAWCPPSGESSGGIGELEDRQSILPACAAPTPSGPNHASRQVLAWRQAQLPSAELTVLILFALVLALFAWCCHTGMASVARALNGQQITVHAVVATAIASAADALAIASPWTALHDRIGRLRCAMTSRFGRTCSATLRGTAWEVGYEAEDIDIDAEPRFGR